MDTGALCDRFPLGSLEGFAIETFNSKEEGSGFFPGDPLSGVLDS